MTRALRFYAALAIYTGSLLALGVYAAKADTIEQAALYAAQEYACEWAPPVDLLALVTQEGIPEDIAVEIIADLAWELVQTSTAESLCGVVVAGGGVMAKIKHIALRALLRERQNNKCCYCRKPMIQTKPGPAPKGGFPHNAETLEHLRRRSEGGQVTPNNVALACIECNNGRGNVDWLTYASYRRGELAA